MRLHPVALLLLLPVAIALDCALKPILKGISVKQDLGFSKKKILPNEADCKGKCAAETDFECQAIMWPGGEGVGDCYLLDKVDLNREIFVDQRPFFLYVSVCDGEPTPSVGYCEFLLTQAAVTRTTDIAYESPGATTESACHEFCIANYRGLDCSAFVVSSDRASTCTLYKDIPSGLDSGPQNLWTKKCSAPPVNCGYSTWSEWTQCTVSCGGGTRTRTRGVSTQPSDNGVQCVDSEMTDNAQCATQDCNPDCMYGEWSEYGTCDATCESTGFRHRTRDIVRENLDGGKPCDAKEQDDKKKCASTEECGSPCMYSTWSGWSTCNSLCEASRSRTLEMGDQASCEIEHGPLENTMVCEGGDCNPLPGEKPPVTTEPEPEVPKEPTPETGCKIASIDPSSKVSSKGYKAVGARQDCAYMCQQEKSFVCEAYITTGPGGPCVLHGEIDRNVIQLAYSKYYLQDLNCKANASPSTGVCEWKMTKGGIDPSFAAPGDYDSIGLTIDAPHCATLCMMNHPIFKPNPCVAYAWNPLIGFASGQDNCFMYNRDAKADSTAEGSFDLYQLVCPE